MMMGVDPMKSFDEGKIFDFIVGFDTGKFGNACQRAGGGIDDDNKTGDAGIAAGTTIGINCKIHIMNYKWLDLKSV